MASQPSSFSVKDLRFVITLTQPGASFAGQNGANTITLSGLRAMATVENAGGGMMGTLNAQIFGVTATDTNTLTSVIWDTPSSVFNEIQVFAVDGSQETLVYNGVILNCWGVYDSMPEVYLMIEAQIGYNHLVQSALPTSIQANTTLATVMQTLASQMGFQFENNGVNIAVPKGTYLGNTAMEQARRLAQMYKFWMYLDSTNPNTLAIAPFATARNVQVTPYISPDTGLIGYPAFNGAGINFQTKFNPGIVFGGPVQVESSVPKANGLWTVVSMTHQLSSQTPGGPWSTAINAVPHNLASQVSA
jgi:Baseplate hub gp41